MLAEALDADEMETYRWWVNSQQDPKKWRWASPDKAGQVYINSEINGRLDKSDMHIAQPLSSLLGLTKRFNNTKRGRVEEWAKATGRTILYRNPDGFMFNDKAELVKDKDVVRNALVFNIDYEGNIL